MQPEPIPDPDPIPDPPDAAEPFPVDPIAEERSSPRDPKTSRIAPGKRARVLSIAAAGAIAVGGYVHYCLYRHGFRAIPKIGVGFLLQGVSSAVLAAALVIGGERVLHAGRWIVRRSAAVRFSALGLSVGTLAAFGLTRTPAGLFNFMERGLEPAPQALIALVAESVAVLLLGAALVTDRLHPRHARQTSGPRHGPTAHLRLDGSS